MPKRCEPKAGEPSAEGQKWWIAQSDRIERAKACDFRVKEGCTRAGVAAYFGTTHKTVNRYLKLLGLPPEIQEAVRRREISITKALALLATHGDRPGSRSEVADGATREDCGPAQEGAGPPYSGDLAAFCRVVSRGAEFGGRGLLSMSRRFLAVAGWLDDRKPSRG
jgi:hypothetical protein